MSIRVHPSDRFRPQALLPTLFTLLAPRPDPASAHNDLARLHAAPSVERGVP